MTSRTAENKALSMHEDPTPSRMPPARRKRRGLRIAICLIGVYIALLGIMLVCEGRLAFPGWTFRKPWIGEPAGTVCP